MADNEEIQISVPKRGRPPKAQAAEAAAEAPAEVVETVEAAPVSAGLMVDGEFVSEQTLREMAAGRQALNTVR